MKKFVLAFLLGTCLSYVALAQDDYEKWLQKEQARFNQYISEEDQKFADFLKKEWVSVGLQKIKPLLTKPKPAAPPSLKKSEGENREQAPNLKQTEKNEKAENQAPPADKTPVDKHEIKPVPAKEKEKTEALNPTIPASTAAPKEKLPDDTGVEKKEIPAGEAVTPAQTPVAAQVTFYQSSQKFSYNPSLKVTVSGEVNNEYFAAYWQEMSKQDFKSVIAQAEKVKKAMRLNDWAYCMLMHEYSKAVYPNDKNFRALFTWYMLVKSGYRARAAYRGSEIFLLLATRNKLFGLPYFGGNDELRFYMVALQPEGTFKLDNIYVYREDFPGSDKEFVFSIQELPKLSDSLFTRKIDLSVDGKKISLSLLANTGLIRLYEFYPQTDYSVYFSAPLSPQAESSLLPQLKEACKGMSTRQALNFLLHFVQRATGYQIDEEQFGREKPLFVEESLRYPQSDCEDRSALYSYLVKKILAMDIVGVYYPGHVATAVAMAEIQSGDYIEWENKKYLICDPTYLGADIGMCMPEYKSVNPEVIRW